MGKSAMADYVTLCMSSPMFTYEDAPVYTLMEKAVTRAFLRRVGYESGAGSSTTGGSTGNQLEILLLSGIRKAPGLKWGGNACLGTSGVIFCSESAHYSTATGVFYQGQLLL